MHRLYRLSDTELEIMEIFWKTDESLSFREVMYIINTTLKRAWKKQTVNTYLSNLQLAGLIKADKRSARAYMYSAAYTKNMYTQICTKKLVEESFDNSITNFVAAFTGGSKLSFDDLEELKKLI